MFEKIKEIEKFLKDAIENREFTVFEPKFNSEKCEVKGELVFEENIRYYFTATTESVLIYSIGPRPYLQFTLDNDEKKQLTLYIWRIMQAEIEMQHQCDVRMIERIVKELE